MNKKKITDILRPDIAEHSVLIGYYGGGNYGDELLLETIQNICHHAGVQDMTIAYQYPDQYATYHHDFGYYRVNMHDKRAVFREILRNKRVIVGGGGLWGLDFGFNVFLLCVLLWASRWLLGKKVYFIGVGYYNSTNRFGRFGAWLAGKAANAILARDQETYDNFRRVNKRTYIDTDIAWYIRDLDLSEYQKDVEELDKQVDVQGKTLLVALRRFQAKQRNNFTSAVEELIQYNPNCPIIVTLLEPERNDPEQHELVRHWGETFENVQAWLTPTNPLALFLFFKKHHKQLALIAPQFHAILTAHLNGVPFLPVVYDNKVAELLKQIGTHDRIPIDTLCHIELQQFAEKFAGDAEK